MSEERKRRGLPPEAYRPVEEGSYTPWVAAGDTSVAEFTLRAVLLGAVLGILFSAANAYLGLKVGMTVTACPSNPLGIKGCGEAGAIGSPPALMNAITDAIGNNDLTMPATPERVWAAIRSAQ